MYLNLVIMESVLIFFNFGQARQLVEFMYSGEVGPLSQAQLSQLLQLGRQLQVEGLLQSAQLPGHIVNKEEDEEEGDDDVFESEVAVDLSPGVRWAVPASSYTQVPL
jgi:hypothetical protein